MPDALLEIGCEELPPGYFTSDNYANLPGWINGLLETYRIKNKQSLWEINATPRRIVIILRNLPEKQSSITKEIFGPKKAVAYQANGSLSPVGEGFLRKTGALPKDIQIKDDKLFVFKQEAGKPTKEILADLFMALFKRIQFTKTMRWENSGTRFARPIRWMVALFGSELIDFELAGVRAGRLTRLHPLQVPLVVAVNDIEDYESKLAQGQVVLSLGKRKKLIKDALVQKAQEIGGCLLLDSDTEALLQKVTMMVEYPMILVGKLNERFRQLPTDVVVTAMREHQQYFSIHDSQGELLPYFLAVYDNPYASAETIQPGCERVLEARLKDAEFFYQEDMKRPLQDLVPVLKRVLWIKGLGNLFERTQRLKTLCEWLAKKLEPGNVQSAQEVAYLSKVDLITAMVQEKEFTSLQGTMGYIYAKNQGWPEAVAKAIYEQYLPRWLNDDLPRTATGRILALADKLDHLVGCWGAGFAPTGTKDPYALRRAAQGLIAITLDAGYGYSLEAALQASSQNFVAFSTNTSSLVAELKGFIQGRLETELSNRGMAPDLIQAVLGVWWDDITAVVQKAEAIHALRGEQGFDEKIITFSRVVNILPKDTPRQVRREEPELPVNASLFSYEAEKILYAAYQKAGSVIAELSQNGKYKDSFEHLASLKPHIDHFFDDVLVMEKNEQLRRNRLNLLENLARKIWSLADFSRLVINH